MSETVNIPIKLDDGWVELAEPGFITSSKSMEYCVSETPPSENLIGHHLKTFGSFDFTASLSTLYVRGEGVLSFTTGSSFNPGGEPSPLGLYQGMRFMSVQTSVESNSKLGMEHEGSTLLNDVVGGGVNDTIFLTGSLPVALKGRIISYTGDGVKAEIYEAPTYTGGVVTDYQNASAINPVPGLSSIIVGAVVSAIGDLVFAPDYLIGNTSNQGKGATGAVVGREKLLKPNTAYLLRITSLDGSIQNISSLLTWYEGELDLPLS